MSEIRRGISFATLLLLLTLVLAACDRDDMLQLSAGGGMGNESAAAERGKRPDAPGKDHVDKRTDAADAEEPSTSDTTSAADDDGGTSPEDAEDAAATDIDDTAEADPRATAESDDVADAGPQSTSVATAIPSHVMWSATHEGGTIGDEWGGAHGSDDAPGFGGGGLYNSGIRSFNLSTEQARSGSHSLKTVIDTVDASGSKENSAAVRAFRWDESESYRDLYFSAWYFIPQHVRPTHFWNIFQFKSKVLDGNRRTLTTDPIWTINIGNRDESGAMYTYLYHHGKYFPNGSSERYKQSRMNIPVGKWFNLEARLVQSTGSSADGRLTVWQDGQLLWDMRNIRTQHSTHEFSRGARLRQSWSANNYSNGLRPSVATVYIDDAAVSRARIWQD